MSVYHQVLEWSKSRPLWQRDGLRRCVTQDKITQQDVEDLVQLCKQPHGLLSPDVTVPEADPFSAEHIAGSGGGQAATAITSLESTQNINGLISDQGLSFSKSGVTVVYGDNAAGKSGYVRVLKRMCRSRGGGKPIKPDVFKEGPQAPASAIVKYAIGGSPDSTNWQDGHPGPVALSAVSVFDASCASVYVENDTDVAFAPAGLDLFGKLARICEMVAAAIKQDLNAIDARKKTFVGFTADTVSGKLVLELSATTSTVLVETISMEAESETEVLAESRRRLAEIEARDPKKVAGDLRLKAGRLLYLLNRLQTVESTISDDAVQSLKVRQEDAATKKKAAILASENLFKDEPLSGIGSNEWKQLWEAARGYSESHAYPDHSFPGAPDDSNCVLCQQSLSPVARSRFVRFEEFVKQAAQKAAKEAESSASSAVNQIRNAVFEKPEDESILGELEAIDIKTAATIKDFLAAATARKAAVLNFYETEAWSSLLEPLPDSGATVLAITATGLKEQATKLEGLDVSKELATRRKAISELQARRLLANHRADIIEEIERLKQRRLLELALRTTTTTGITQKSTELTKAVVTEALKQRLEDELKALGMTSLPIRLVPVGGELGSLHHKIQLVARDGSPFSVEDIASEGEHRTIALAAFLAELATEHSTSALVFDDPVSSLDHIRRRRVAERLVREALIRQVVIFTHDIALVVLLNEALAVHGTIPRADLHILRRGNRPGYCEVGLPWGGMTAEQRIRALKAEVQSLRALRAGATDTEYATQVGGFYGRLQEAWERAIEGVLFNGVINRVERDVHTKQLKTVHIGPADCDAVVKGVGTCSKWRHGHDEPDGMNEPYPSPDQVFSDVEALESWVKGIKDRRELAKAKAKDLASGKIAAVTQLSLVNSESSTVT